MTVVDLPLCLHCEHRTEEGDASPNLNLGFPGGCVVVGCESMTFHRHCFIRKHAACTTNGCVIE